MILTSLNWTPDEQHIFCCFQISKRNIGETLKPRFKPRFRIMDFHFECDLFGALQVRFSQDFLKLFWLRWFEISSDFTKNLNNHSIHQLRRIPPFSSNFWAPLQSSRAPAYLGESWSGRSLRHGQPFLPWWPPTLAAKDAARNLRSTGSVGWAAVFAVFLEHQMAGQ